MLRDPKELINDHYYYLIIRYCRYVMESLNFLRVMRSMSPRLHERGLVVVIKS